MDDLSCKAFVQLADTHVLIGGKFDKSSVLDGEQREFTLRWQFCPATECKAWEGWWLRYDGGATSEWVGFYPRNRYSANGLHDEGSRVDFGGEVAYLQAASHPTTDMGSGQAAAAGFGVHALLRRPRSDEPVAHGGRQVRVFAVPRLQRLRPVRRWHL